MEEEANSSHADSEVTPQPLRVGPPAPQPLPSLLQTFSPRPKQERTLLHDYSHIYMDSSGDEDNIPPAPPSAMLHPSNADESRGARGSNQPLELPLLSHVSVGEDPRGQRSISAPKERPPMSEVLLNQEIEHNENDTFSDERSLEPKVRRSLNLAPATPPRVATPRRNYYRRAHPPSVSPGTTRSPSSDHHVNGASPAWLRLKHDMQTANDKLAKLEKENAKLAETCKSLTEELRRTSDSTDQADSLQEEMERLKRTVDLLSYQNKQLSKEKRALMFGARQFDEDKILLVEARQAAERSELEAIEENNALEEQLRSVRSEFIALQDERDRMATELEEAIQSKVILEQEKTELIVRMHSMNEDTNQMSSPAEAAAASKAETSLRRKSELQKREIVQLKATLEEERNKYRELASSEMIHQSELQSLRKETDSLKREVSNLRSTLKDPENQIPTHPDEESRTAALEEANNSMKLEIVQLTAELEDANLQTQTLGRSASRAEAEIQSLIEDNESLRLEVAQMTASLRETTAKCHALLSEKELLQSERDSLQVEVDELRQSQLSTPPPPPPTAEIGTQTDYLLEPASPPRQKLNSGSPSVSSLSERIDRIRDSAERATLVRDHQRDILRLKKDHEAEISKLRAEHDSLIRRLAKEAKSEMDIRNKDLQRRLETEYEKKIADLVRHHEKELARLQAELKNESITAEESVQAAMSKVASTMQRLERETKKREALEHSLDQIHQEHNAEYQKILELHRQELELLREEWEEDKNALLAVVQNECNLVFDRNRALNRSSISRTEPRLSPRNSSSETTSRRKVEQLASTGDETVLMMTTCNDGDTLLSQINRDLRETENLVKGLVGGVPSIPLTTER